MVNPLFYDRIVPLNTTAHRELHLGPVPRPFGFAAAANLIPALLDEFSAAAPFMPVAFLPGAERPAAVFVVGLKPGQNLFVDAGGQWAGGYLPAYLRRYPFIMGDVPEGEPILCVDETFEGLGSTGVRLFTEAGEPAPPLTQALALADNYRRGATRSDAFCAALQELKLFRSVTLEARQPDGEATVVHGLLVVDEDAFDALSDAKVKYLHAQKFLRPIFAHLVSLAALSRLSERLPLQVEGGAASIAAA